MSTDLVSQALTALRQKDFVAARDCMTRYAADHRLEFQHYLMKGLAEIALQDWTTAAATFEEAAGLFPHQPQLWLNLGIALENIGETDRAVDAYEHCLDVQPDTADACGNLSNLYRRRGRVEEAEALAHRAYEQGASKAQALNTLGLAIARQGKFEAAAKVFAEAQQLAPNNPDILCNIANLAVDQLKFDEAWPLFAAARAAGESPTLRYHEGMARLLSGDYTQGWALAESRLELPNALRVRPTCPIWKGENLQGKKLLLVAEQGYGDTIQFCRYGKCFENMGVTLIWVVREPLQRLLAANVAGHVVTDEDALPDAHYWLPLMSLPYALGVLRPEESPAAPYMRVPDGAAPYNLPNDKRRVGIVWTGSPTHERDRERSIPLEMFQPLFDKIPVNYYAPALGLDDDNVPMPKPFLPITSAMKDFADTASLLNSLDVLVTVDTAAAHLAGALGIRTFLLLPFCPDWRWGASGTVSPWYSSVTLLRQPRYGDWGAVMGVLMERLSPGVS